MAIIAPFRGTTYNFHSGQDLSRLVTPPYDVISEKEQDEYYQADPHNIIRLILGKRKVGDSDWDNRYTRAADDFSRWDSEGVLKRAADPGIYLTSLTYDPGNGEGLRTRWGIICLVKIEDEGSRVILPHEKTFSAHKDDRLKLMRACSAQFSQIFGLYEDAENAVLDACRNDATASPQIAFEFKDGTQHQMWRLKDRTLFTQIARTMADKPIFIADGHHRYETARNYRNILRKKYGGQHTGRSYEYVMMYLSNMNDKGLTILPSHRLVKTDAVIEIRPFLDSLEQWFNITSLPDSDVGIAERCAALKKELEKRGLHNTVMAFCHHSAEQSYLFSLKPDAREKVGKGIHPSLRKLDVLVLSKLVLQEALGFTRADLDNSEIFHYQSNMEAAVADVVSGKYQMAFLLNPTKMEHVREIAGNSLVMPRKSTYFYPKVLTGLVLNKIDPNETIFTP